MTRPDQPALPATAADALFDGVAQYSAKQMHAYGLASYRAGMEQAAQIAEAEARLFWDRSDVHDEFAACAAAIRRAAEGSKT